MARVHPFQTNFTAGEFTPKLTGQVAFKKYANAVELHETGYYQVDYNKLPI